MARKDLLTFKNVNLILINADSNMNNLIKCTIFMILEEVVKLKLKNNANYI